MGTRKLSKTDLAKLRRQVRDQERRFKAMTKAQKRVAVAKDVLQQIASKRLRPKQGTYLNGSITRELSDVSYDRRYGDRVDMPLDTQVRDLLIEQPACTACALGALFVCDVIRRDKLTVDTVTTDGGDASLTNDEFMRTRLSAYFSPRQLVLIEVAFEGKFLNLLSSREEYEANFGVENIYARARDFNVGVTNATTRMKNIMNNIIENRGTFKP